jgi:RNA polymerase sigma factor (sigma-70 family)
VICLAAKQSNHQADDHDDALRLSPTDATIRGRLPRRDRWSQPLHGQIWPTPFELPKGNKSVPRSVFFSMLSTGPGFHSLKLGVNGSSPNGPVGRAPSSVPTDHVAPAETALSGEDDSARFARVVLPYLDDAYELARWLAGNRADAEDIVQEACLRAFRSIARFKEGNARAWVLTIVRNTAYTWLGRNRSANLVVTDDLEAVERAETDRGHPSGFEIETPEAALIAKAEAARVQTALAALPAPFRETLVLRDLQGFDYREIAAITGVPVGTVMSRLARARRRLMGSIVKDDDDAHV